MKLKRIKKVVSKVSSILIIILLTISLYNFVSIKLLKKDLVEVFGYAMLEVVSGSMEPTIGVGDLIIINTNYKNLKKDDIVTFLDEESNFVTHRIVSVNKNNVVTQGDANSSDDGKINYKSIVGKYVCKLSGFGNVIAFMKKPIVILMMFVISLVLCYITSMNKGDDLVLGKREEKQFLEYLEDREKFINKTKRNIKRRISRGAKTKKKKRKKNKKRKR